MPEIQGPTQYRELAESGDLPAPMRSADDVGGVNVTQALDAARGDSADEITDDEKSAVIALVRGESDDLDGVKKDHLEAAIDDYNANVDDEADHLSKSGNKAELLERLRDAVNS